MIDQIDQIDAEPTKAFFVDILIRDNYLKASQPVKADSLTQRAVFQAPSRQSVARKGPRTVKVQYSRPVKDVDFLKDALDVNSATAVGEKTFDFVLKRQRGK
jgi:hypothetical protein